MRKRLKRWKKGLKRKLRSGSLIYLGVPVVLGMSLGPGTNAIKKHYRISSERNKRIHIDEEEYNAPLDDVDVLEISDKDFKPDEIPVYPDHVYESRVKHLSKEMPMQLNQYVKDYIDGYTLQSRPEVKQLLDRGEQYFPLIEEILREEGVPQELKNLAVIESGLKPDAKSHAGAVGMWQFMKPTAQESKLKVNSHIDERKNVEKSTRAAAKYLKKMHNKYGDWFLALAAYNYGPGNIDKVIRKAGRGKKPTYWEIRSFLPKETRHYVPKFIAACYVMKYHKQHNLQPESQTRLAEVR